MMRNAIRTALLAFALLLPGCSHNSREVALYDLGPAQTAQPLPFPVLLEPFDSAPPYMRKELLYRLDYAGEPLRPYAGSAWRIPPDSLFAELLLQTAKGSLLTVGPSPLRARCALHIGLARFEQAFSDEKNSKAEVEVNYSLVQLRTRRELKRGNVHESVAAATADAQGGAQALQEASRQAAAGIMMQVNELLAASAPAHAACAP